MAKATTNIAALAVMVELVIARQALALFFLAIEVRPAFIALDAIVISRFEVVWLAADASLERSTKSAGSVARPAIQTRCIKPSKALTLFC